MFGPNWKTTVSGIGAALFALLTFVAALPYELGSVADIFPPTWKVKIAVAGALAAFLLKSYNSLQQKDKNVTGGSVPQTLAGNYAPVEKSELVAATKAVSPPAEQTIAPITPTITKAP